MYKLNKNQPQDLDSLGAHIKGWLLLKWTDLTNYSNVDVDLFLNVGGHNNRKITTPPHGVTVEIK